MNDGPHTVSGVGGDLEPDACADVRGWDEFAPLYDEHHQRLYRIALLLCHGRPAIAEDAVAETFLSVYRAWADRGIENFWAYSRKVLLNHVIGQTRRENVANRHRERQSGDGRGELAAEDRVLDSDATFALLGRLAPRQRASIVLRFYEDMPYDQIATELGVTPGTVKAQISTGLARLRTLMDGDLSG